MVVARGPGHREQAPGVAATLRYLQIALGIQERRALGEEDREPSHGGIGHGILHIIARAFIRKPRNGRAKKRHQVVEGRGTCCRLKWEAHRRLKFCCTFPVSYTDLAMKCLVLYSRIVRIRIENC